MTQQDPYIYDIELLRAKRLEQLELYPEMKYPPVREDEAIPNRKAKARVDRVRKVRKRRKSS